jgi:hypothetical protein
MGRAEALLRSEVQPAGSQLVTHLHSTSDPHHLFVASQLQGSALPFQSESVTVRVPVTATPAERREAFAQLKRALAARVGHVDPDKRMPG